MRDEPTCCERHVDTAPPPRLFGRKMIEEKPGNANSSTTNMLEDFVDQHEKEPSS